MVIDYFMDDRSFPIPIEASPETQHRSALQSSMVTETKVQELKHVLSILWVREIADDGSVFFNTAPVSSQN
jgi:hypothetical protein